LGSIVEHTLTILQIILLVHMRRLHIRRGADSSGEQAVSNLRDHAVGEHIGGGAVNGAAGNATLSARSSQGFLNMSWCT